MRSLLRSRPAAVWLLLVVATLFSWESAVMAGSRQMTAVLVLLLGFFKVWMIGIEFMELRRAPRALRIAFEGWVVGITVILLVLE